MIVVQAREPDRGKLLFNGSVGSFNASWDRRVISTRSTVGDGKPSRSDHSIESVSHRNTRKEPLIYPSTAVPCCAPRPIIQSHILVTPYPCWEVDPVQVSGSGVYYVLPGPFVLLLTTTGSSLECPIRFGNEHARIRCVSSAHLPTLSPEFNLPGGTLRASLCWPMPWGSEHRPEAQNPDKHDI